jgi:hypothetical protein
MGRLSQIRILRYLSIGYVAVLKAVPPLTSSISVCLHGRLH